MKNNQLNPTQIITLMHLHVRAAVPEDNPAYDWALKNLTERGAVEVVEVEGEPETTYQLTALGNAWVKALRRVPPPKQVFIDANGEEL